MPSQRLVYAVTGLVLVALLCHTSDSSSVWADIKQMALSHNCCIKKWCLSVGWALPRCSCLHEEFSVINTDNLQNFLLIFYEICNLVCKPFTSAIEVEFKFGKSVLAHAEPCWVRCVVKRSDLTGVEDTHLPCVVIQCYGCIRVPWNLGRPTKLCSAFWPSKLG